MRLTVYLASRYVTPRLEHLQNYAASSFTDTDGARPTHLHGFPAASVPATRGPHAEVSVYPRTIPSRQPLRGLPLLGLPYYWAVALDLPRPRIAVKVIFIAGTVCLSA